MQVFVFRHVLFLWYHTADLAHLSPRHPEMTHLMKIRINHHHKRICLLPTVLLFFYYFNLDSLVRGECKQQEPGGGLPPRHSEGDACVHQRITFVTLVVSRDIFTFKQVVY